VGGEKVRMASLLQGSGLVRTEGPCAQRSVASGHRSARDEFLNERHEALSPSLKRSEWQGLFFVMLINSPVDSTFEQSEDVAIAHFLLMNSSSCCCKRWPAVRGVACARVGSKFFQLSSAHAYCTNGQSCLQDS
jgi:hypothetical protein